MRGESQADNGTSRKELILDKDKHYMRKYCFPSHALTVLWLLQAGGVGGGPKGELGTLRNKLILEN
jgi:hypothetical protein